MIAAGSMVSAPATGRTAPWSSTASPPRSAGTRWSTVAGEPVVFLGASNHNVQALHALDSWTQAPRPPPFALLDATLALDSVARLAVARCYRRGPSGCATPSRRWPESRPRPRIRRERRGLAAAWSATGMARRTRRADPAPPSRPGQAADGGRASTTNTTFRDRLGNRVATATRRRLHRGPRQRRRGTPQERGTGSHRGRTEDA